MIFISGKTFNSWIKVPIKANDKLLDLFIAKNDLLEKQLSILGFQAFGYNQTFGSRSKAINLCPNHSS